MLYESKFYTSQPSSTDKNFTTIAKGGYSHCIDRNGKGYTLPNCVAFVHGQWLYQLTAALGVDKAKEYESLMCRNNAEVYWSKNESFVHSQEPKIGAIMVWEGKGSLAGHVMIVKEIMANGDVLAIGSNYSGTSGNKKIFYDKVYYKKKNYDFSTSYTFKGFIHLPIEVAKAVTVPVHRDKNREQIEVVSDNLNVRTGHSTAAHRQGYAARGYYDVYDTFVGDDVMLNGTWYCIDKENNLWVAGRYVKLYPHKVITKKIVIESVTEDVAEQITTFLYSLNVSYEISTNT